MIPVRMRDEYMPCSRKRFPRFEEMRIRIGTEIDQQVVHESLLPRSNIFAPRFKRFSAKIAIAIHCGNSFRSGST